jgi:probable rRNA maturation factor
MNEFKPEITFTSQTNFIFKHKIFYKLWIVLVVLSEKKLFNKINFIFVDDASILDINRKHLQHDYLTDIITFDYSEQFEPTEIDIKQYKKFFKSTYNFIPQIEQTISELKKLTVISGDIYISIPTVLDNSKSLEKDFADELNRVLVHGILHLCGHGDKSPAEKRLMRILENRYINYLNTL